MATQSLSDLLRALDACAEARLWAADYDTLDDAWVVCSRGDWMLWLAARVSPPGSEAHRRVVRAACACARLALMFIPAGEHRPFRAIEMAERWAHGDNGVTMQDIRSAAAAAYTAPVSGAASYATQAAAAAADAVAEAGVGDANYAANAAAYAAAATVEAGDTLRLATLRRCADLVREHYSQIPTYMSKGVR